MVRVEDMARCREERVRRQQLLLSGRGGCAVSFTMNIAGAVKRTPLIEKGFNLGLRLIFAALRYAGYAPQDIDIRREETGCEMLCAVDAQALDVKKALYPLEEQDDFGRLMDIDVIGADGMKVARGDVGLPPRTCLLCGELASVCGRSRAHSADSLFLRAEAIIRQRLVEEDAVRLGALAQKALLLEAAITPKPGLVDRDNQGAHRDMDLLTFMASAAALRPYFEQCVRTGAHLQEEPPPRTMERLRFLGRFAENDMLAATKGVNTHKGAVYGMGILLGAAGRLWGKKRTQDSLLGAAADIAREEADRLPVLAASGEDTAGVRLFQASGLTGARGQAAAGFPLVRSVGLPCLYAALESGMSLNDAAVFALLSLMAKADDSNVFKRGGQEGQTWVREQARALAALPLNMEAVRGMDRACIRRNISPGGCADLTAFTLFVYFMMEDNT